MSAGIGYDLYKLGFQVSPIILTHGIAASIPGHLLPIIAITESANFVDGLLSGNININLDSFFAQYQPSTGNTLQNYEVATYPFANSAVAANSIIAEPLHISVLMTCPVRDTIGYYFKLAIMSALQKALSLHNTSGGMYTIVTPSYIYQNCLMTSMTDVSGSGTKQRQYQWQIEFMQPLVTAAQAAGAESALMNALHNQINPGNTAGQPLTWSGLSTLVASPFQQIAQIGQSILGAANNIVGAL